MANPDLDTQLLEAAVEQMKQNFVPGQHSEVFFPGGETAGMIEGGTMTVTQDHADRVKIFRTLNGAEEEILLHHLAKTLAKKRVDARTGREVPVFSLTPTVKPNVGPLNCYLHIDSEHRPAWDAMGVMTVCTKAGFSSPFELEAHMGSAHSREWKAFEHDRELAEKRRVDARQEALMDALVRNSTGTAVAEEPFHRGPGRPRKDE